MPSFVNARPNLLVQDVSASVEFYTDTLGFEAVAMMGEPPFFALLVNEGAEIALVTAGPSNLPTSSLLLRN